MFEYYEMFFNNTNGNGRRKWWRIIAAAHNFYDYDDFLEHIKDTHRHIYIAEDLEQYEESAAETALTLLSTQKKMFQN